MIKQKITPSFILHFFFHFRYKDIWKNKIHSDESNDRETQHEANIMANAPEPTVLTRNLNKNEVNFINSRDIVI